MSSKMAQAWSRWQMPAMHDIPARHAAHDEDYVDVATAAMPRHDLVDERQADTGAGELVVVVQALEHAE